MMYQMCYRLSRAEIMPEEHALALVPRGEAKTPIYNIPQMKNIN